MFFERQHVEFSEALINMLQISVNDQKDYILNPLTTDNTWLNHNIKNC